ncbi:MAG: M43 family zinc metalloprotease, partial [Flavobacteriales bacterium]
MTNKLSILLLFAIFFSQLIQAQRTCGSMLDYQNHIQNNPDFLAKQLELENLTQQYQQLIPLMNSSENVYTIPVVIHILYNNSEQNISDEQINSQMISLNNDFRALNSDLSNLPAPFENLIADSQIEFCLAQIDPEGNPTSGINRVFTNQNSFSYNNNMKFTSSGGVDAWDTDLYLNIWVCNLNNLLGYAQFPGGDPTTDGVVVANTAFGSTGIAAAPYNLGRTLTHEIGHWLNLRHIWGDSNCGNDFVDDTPAHEQANYGCPTYPQISCDNGPSGDLFMNYMDYTNDACMYMFTQGQKNRMIAALLNSRASLLNSNVCSANIITGCTDPNASNYNAEATVDNDSCLYLCQSNSLLLEINTDCYPEETSWQLFNEQGILLQSSNSYENLDLTTIEEEFCLENGCYSIIFSDSYGDGLNGASWSCGVDGSYNFGYSNGETIFSMAEPNFGLSITHDFCIGSNDIYGCTNSEADNYNSSANNDDGSCIISGCTNTQADNYNPSANNDDGSCIISGCTNTQADNYNPLANNDDGSCIISGCTDAQAENYNPLANNDNGSCIYSCNSNTLFFNLETDCYPEEISWQLFNEQGLLIQSSSSYSGMSLTLIQEEFCLEDGCYIMIINDSYGDGLNGSAWSCGIDGDYYMNNENSEPIFEMQNANYGSSITHEFCVGTQDVTGCTNPDATNFNPDATEDDGSCIIYGCTDPAADNHNPNANTDDGSCDYCGDFEAVLISSSDATVAGACNG